MNLEKFAADYRSAQPFPHIVIERFFDPAKLEAVLGEWPAESDPRWNVKQVGTSFKLGCHALKEMGPATQEVIDYLNSQPFLDQLSVMTGIEGLVADPDLIGGGLHHIPVGGFLKVHADFNWHEILKMRRRLNLLLYLNHNWSEDYRGALELWDQGMLQAVRKVEPVFNRCVVFNTDDDSNHGHPLPLRCPPGRARKSIALYYYTPAENVVPHSTLYREKKSGLLERVKTSLGLDRP